MAYFIHFLRKTGYKWLNLRSDRTYLNELVMQFDNNRPHVAKETKEFLGNRYVEILYVHSYLPDLNMCDRWLFNLF